MIVMEEKFWLTDFTSLLKQINFVPYGDVASGSRLNAITRIIIVIYLFMLFCKYKYANTFLVISLIFVIIVYMCYKDNVVKGLHINTTMKEPFVIDDNMIKKQDETKQSYFNKEYKTYPKLNYNMFGRDYKFYPEQEVFKNTIDQNKLLPNTKRDKEAGIQYYTPDVGVNDRMFIEPIIAPRPYDREVWAYSSTFPSGMNNDTLYDVTQGNNFPENTNNYKQYEYGKYNYQRDDRSVYSNVGDWEADQRYLNPMIQLGNLDQNLKNENEEKKINIATKYVNPSDQLENMNRTLYADNRIEKSLGNPDYVDPSVNNYQGASTSLQDYRFFPETNNLQSQVGGKPKYTAIQDVLNKEPKTGNYMIEPTPTYIYTEEYLNRPEKRLYLQDVQPNIYSFSVDQEPINNNIGITYTPQNPPKFRDQVYTNNKNYPVYTRVDPQLVRDAGLTPGQKAEQPERNGISAQYSNWNPPAGSINFEDIYDPRFTSYGDPYRGYSDVNLGQVQYYYSDLDVYKEPNFIIRSNIDYVMYQTPNNQEKPYYERTASLEDVKDIVENRYDADDLYHREDLMSSQMSKRKSELWQLKASPLRKQNNSRFSTYGPGI